MSIYDQVAHHNHHSRSAETLVFSFYIFYSLIFLIYYLKLRITSAGEQWPKLIPNLHGLYEKPLSARRLLHWFVRPTLALLKMLALHAYRIRQIHKTCRLPRFFSQSTTWFCNNFGSMHLSVRALIRQCRSLFADTRCASQRFLSSHMDDNLG